ncbi:unnamed protein product [Anisakis simplex]|uniref:Uncharacterized protein n=1 Tax=Anisakis simplex TaxID=6269 RepID=A0A0M3J1B4_ANISI|nr:unnamed protein product [Anisakis simplex]
MKPSVIDEDTSTTLENTPNNNDNRIECKNGDGLTVTSLDDNDTCKYGELILLGFVL